ncbi:MAG: hypothetical protein FJX77_12960 [Armatimonadetes bacterium]|nr:hypothetical protein [Armatimonadota bacterium]
MVRWLRAAAVLAVGYGCLLPLFRPRGAYLGGHYRLLDLYLGALALWVAIWLSLYLAAGTAQQRRTGALRWLLAGLVGGGTLLLLDLGVALLTPGNFWFDSLNLFPGVNRPDPEFGFRGRPRIRDWVLRRAVTRPGRTELYVARHRTDGNGFRNPTDISVAPLLFLGDSYTHGVDLPREETFVGQVERELGMVALNLAWIGFGPQQELLALRKYGLAARPQWVVWQLFEGNDLQDAERFDAWRRDPRPPAISASLRYVTRSPLVRLLDRTVLHPPPTPPATFVRYPSGQRRSEPLLHLYDPHLPTARSAGMRRLWEALTARAELCRRNGARLLVVVLPIPVRALQPVLEFDSSTERTRLLPAGNFDADTDFCATLQREAPGRGIELTDLTEPMRARARRSPDLFLPTDGHLDREGHRVVAEEILNWIRSRSGGGGEGSGPRAGGRGRPGGSKTRS